ncbi:hypothetical protein IWZ01DRAFT_573413 [Phyllosticta capitalensis]
MDIEIIIPRNRQQAIALLTRRDQTRDITFQIQQLKRSIKRPAPNRDLAQHHGPGKRQAIQDEEAVGGAHGAQRREDGVEVVAAPRHAHEDAAKLVQPRKPFADAAPARHFVRDGVAERAEVVAQRERSHVAEERQRRRVEESLERADLPEAEARVLVDEGEEFEVAGWSVIMVQKSRWQSALYMDWHVAAKWNRLALVWLRLVYLIYLSVVLGSVSKGQQSCSVAVQRKWPSASYLSLKRWTVDFKPAAS